MIFAIISAILAYRKAKDAGRNGLLWALIAAATFIGTQFVVALFLGIVVGLVIGFTNQPEPNWGNVDIIITIVAVILSFGTTWGVLKYLDRVPPEHTYTPPPPPDSFN